MKILNLTKNRVLAENAKRADTFFLRLKGFIGRAHLNPGEALVIKNCQGIHMMFMRFAIDAIFVDKSNRAVGLAKNIKPFQFSAIFWKANYVIEIPMGTIENSKTQIGDEIKIN